MFSGYQNEFSSFSQYSQIFITWGGFIIDVLRTFLFAQREILCFSVCTIWLCYGLTRDKAPEQRLGSVIDYKKVRENLIKY